jgi:hypothetical protein
MTEDNGWDDLYNDHEKILLEVKKCNPKPGENPWDTIMRIREESEGWRNGQEQMQNIASGLMDSIDKYVSDQKKANFEIANLKGQLERTLLELTRLTLALGESVGI